MLEKCYSISRAAEQLGVDRRTLKRLLMEELQMVLPPIRRGRHQMIPESLLERLIQKTSPHVDYKLLRVPSKRSHVA